MPVSRERLGPARGGRTRRQRRLGASWSASRNRGAAVTGLRATLVCLDPKKLPTRFAGRSFDVALLRELPPNVDPCGERGEFHTFVTAGPMFDREIRATAGVVVERDGFVFADLLPANTNAGAP
ncbi:MAG: hypothetical protein ACLPP2_06475 [Thermoplasmata archaeon]